MMANKRTKQSAFTLVELLIVISIISVLSLMALAVLANAGNDAKKSATRLTIMKINDLLMDRWEEFESRSLPFRLATNSVQRNPRNAARIRLFTLRELMRLELPDRYTDITNGPIAYDVPIEQTSGAITTVTFTVGNNSLNGYYQSRLSPGFTTEFQGAECLYLILSSMQDEFGNGLDSFKDSIGDVDNDGMPDAWERLKGLNPNEADHNGTDLDPTG